MENETLKKAYGIIEKMDISKEQKNILILVADMCFQAGALDVLEKENKKLNETHPNGTA